jgi:hypothetical protein
MAQIVNGQFIIVATVLAMMVAPSRTAEAQIGKRILQLGACGGGALIGSRVGSKIGEKLAAFEATRRKLSSQDAELIKKGFQIGFALALCGGGAAVAGTTYGLLSKRGKELRLQELLAAVSDAQPRTYSDPERPTLRGTLTPRPSVVEDDRECRVVEDYLADGARGDSALIRYCRPAAGGAWKVDTL